MSPVVWSLVTRLSAASQRDVLRDRVGHVADCPGDSGKEVGVFESTRSCVVVHGRLVVSLGLDDPDFRQRR